MCQTCGCAATEASTGRAADARTVEVLGALMSANDAEAAHVRAHLERAGVLAINLMSSPGSGKTALLEATIEALAGRLRVAVIEGDLETENDAARIRAKGVPAVQITTGTACHLDAAMVHGALHALDLNEIDVLFIENVGNLVCPASFDLGHHANVTLLSAAEGDDKPAKYPVMFRAADVMLLSKADLIPLLGDFDPDRATAHLRALANPAPAFALSARQPQTLAPWLAWLDFMLARLRAGEALRPAVQREGTGHAHSRDHLHEHVHADGTRHSHPQAHDEPHGHDHAHDAARVTAAAIGERRP